MPLTRYQARNEYGLADPDLYQAADKDDPEALLEGVAMAGLVGILRQLGDLAEFAAEMFHDLHEEVMATASRSHGLMARVQQLEAEVPFIEKALLCQTDHSPFFCDKGVEWHPNLQLDQCVVTRGDLPRCVMDSYEECRPPPRLFLLDKFDISGAGACLKRYTDPSFVRLETSSYEASWDDIQREKKSQKPKRRAAHWRNGGTPENALSSHAKLHELFLEEHLEAHHSDPARVVKLKTRKLDGYSLISKSGESYMEKFVQTCADNKTGYQIITPNPELLTWHVDNARDIVTDTPEISMVGALEKSHKGSRAEVSLSDEHENVANMNLNGSFIEKDIETVPESTHSKVPGTTIKDSHANLDGKLGFLQQRSYSEDLTSETENYVDAPATMESETETDDECRPKYRSGALKNGNHRTYSDVDEERMEDPSQFSFPHSTGNTPVSENGQSSFGKQSTSFSYSDTASISIDDQSDGEKFSGRLPSASSFKSELVDSTSHITPEAEKVSSDFNVQESDSNRKLDGQTSFSSNDTCSTTRQDSQNAESCLPTVQSIPKVAETSPERVRLDLIKGGGNDGNKVDPVDSSRSCASFDGKNSNFPSETSSVSSTSEGSRCDTSIEKSYMVDYSSNLVNAGTSSNLAISGSDPKICEDSRLTGQLLPCSAGMGMEASPDMTSEVCGLGTVSEIHLKDTPDDETDCITVTNAVADVDSKISVDVDSQSSVAQITNQHSCAFGPTADVSVSDSHEDTLENGMCFPVEVDSKLTSDFNSGGGKLAEEASPSKCDEHISDERLYDLPRLDNAATDIFPKVELVVSDNLSDTSNGDVCPTACVSSTSSIGSLPWISTKTCRSSSEAAEICHDTVVESNGTLPAEHNPESPRKTEKSPLDVSPEGLGTALDNNDLGSCQSLSPMTSLDQSERDAETSFPCMGILVDNSVDSSPMNNVNPFEIVAIDQSVRVQTTCASDALADEELLHSSVSGVLEFVPQSASLELVPQSSGVELNIPKQDMNRDPTIPSFGLIPETTPDQEDMPPLPPLPPMQWRIAKISHSSFPTFMGESVETRSSAPSLTPPIACSSNVQIGSKPPEQSVSLGSEKSGECVNFASEKPLQSSLQVPTVDTDWNSQYDGSQKTQLVTLSNKLPTMPSQGSTEELCYAENDLLADHAARNQELIYSEETSPQLPQDSSVKYEDFKDDTDVHVSQSSTDHLHFSENKALMPGQSTKEEEKGHAVHASNAEPSSSSVQKIAVGDAMWPVNAFTVAPTLDTNKLEEVPMIRLPRPRSPLVDAVAAHDRRTMKKVSERIQPPIKQKQDDKDSLLAQIRNKSVSLKPAVATRPSIQTGPKTNFKVAAILEKANTIRQAVVGSDEDEDSDSWSDS